MANATTLKMTQVMLTAQMAGDLNKAEKTLKLLNESSRNQGHGTNQAYMSTIATMAMTMDHNRTSKEIIMNMPLLPMSPPPVNPPRSYSAPPAIPSIAKWLFKDHDFLFSHN
jgi:hypothetical protein